MVYTHIYGSNGSDIFFSVAKLSSGQLATNANTNVCIRDQGVQRNGLLGGPTERLPSCCVFSTHTH